MPITKEERICPFSSPREGPPLECFKDECQLWVIRETKFGYYKVCALRDIADPLHEISASKF